MEISKDYFVDVCDNCLTASCWHGEFLCDGSSNAGIKKVKASELLEKAKEHPDNFSIEKLMSVCGSIDYVNDNGL